jgi:hypothetical protein
LRKALHEVFHNSCPPTTLHTFLAREIDVPLLIITTNYDDLIEQALNEEGKEYDLVIHTIESEYTNKLLVWPHGEKEPTRVSPKGLDIDLKQRTVVYKMHGAVDRRESTRDQYVITEDHYTRL